MDPDNELQGVERASLWNPLNYDHDMFPVSKAVSHFIIIQALLIVAMNGAVVVVAARSRHLLASAANVFYVGMCLNNWLYGAVILVYRIGFATFGFHWTEASCYWYSAINVFCVGTGALHVLTICMERYLALIKLKRLSVRQAFLSVGGLYGQSAAFTSLHYIFGGKGIIANSGIFCFPTAFASWIGVFDMTIIVSCVAAIFVTYAIIWVQLRKVTRASSTAFHFPGLGATTMMALGQSKTGISPASAPSPRDSRLSSIQKSLSTLFPKYPTIRTTAELSSNSHASQSSHGYHSSPTHGGESTSDSERHRSISQMAQERADESKEAERRVLKRGAFSFLAYSFVYPFCYFIWLGVRYGARPPTVFDLVFCATKFISELSDPIILFSLDRGFNEELRRLLGAGRSTVKASVDAGLARPSELQAHEESPNEK